MDSVPPVIWFIRTQLRDRRHGLSLPQLRILAKVDCQPTASLSAVAEHIAASLPTASRIVNGLVQKGLLARRTDLQDRRQLALGITPRGRAVLDAAWSGVLASLQAETELLSSRERATIEKAMVILRSRFGSAGLREHLDRHHGDVRAPDTNGSARRPARRSARLRPPAPLVTPISR